MLKRICSIIFLITALVLIGCFQLSGIMLICKVCGATSISWIGCCIPLIIAIVIFPLFGFTRVIVTDKEDK